MYFDPNWSGLAESKANLKEKKNAWRRHLKLVKRLGERERKTKDLGSGIDITKKEFLKNY